MRILICSHWMEIGGAERALLGLLYSIDYNKHDVDLYLCRHTGEFLPFIPNKVNLLPEDKRAAAIAIPAKQALYQGCFGIVLGRVIGKILAYQYVKKCNGVINNIAIEYSNKFTYPFVKKINPNITYDLAISFLEPHYIAAHKVKANKKIAWIHTDYESIGVDIKSGYKIWNCFDAIASISDASKENFLKKFTNLSEKLLVIENINHPYLIKNQANLFSVKSEMSGNVVLLSVGRFSPSKNFDNVPDICARIRKSGIDVKWYLIGYGGEENLIRQKIVDANMQEYVIILGKKENPYPYIANCDLYVQPSRYEGKAVTVREAQILGKPVVITRYSTSSSQLEDNIDGVIVPLDNEGCANGIIEFLKDTEKLSRITNECKNREYSNTSEIEKIYKI